MSGRNDAARGRRRNKIKEDLSLTSVPNSEIASQTEKGINYDSLNLSNHFGWRTVGFARLGEDGFPHVAQFLEKPDVKGDCDQVTYVLYLEKGGSIDRDSAIKQTQTGDSHLQLQQVPPKKDKARVSLPAEEDEPEVIEEHIDTEDEGHERESTDKKKRKRRSLKKMISEFYYVPKERSRSRKRDKSNEGGDHETKLTPDTSKTDLPDSDADKEVKEEVEKNKKNKMGRGRGKGPDRWQLRAGAEHASETMLQEIPEHNLSKRLSVHSSEYLLESPSGTNKYLYVSKDRGCSTTSTADD